MEWHNHFQHATDGFIAEQHHAKIFNITAKGRRGCYSAIVFPITINNWAYSKVGITLNREMGMFTTF